MYLDIVLHANKKVNNKTAKQYLSFSTQKVPKRHHSTVFMLVGWLKFNVPFQHKYGYIRDELFLCN